MPRREREKQMRRYYGWNEAEGRVMIATITGQMADGSYIYTECDGNFNLINIDMQYTRTLKYGSQIFFRI